MLNKDGSITICGIHFDIPLSEDISKPWNSTVIKEGKTTTRNIWIDSYNVENGAYTRVSHKISMTNRGRVEFDEKNVTKKEDVENIKYIFETVKEIKP